MCAGVTRPSKPAMCFSAAAPWILLIRFAAYSLRDFKPKFNSPKSQAESGRLPLTCNSDGKITELIEEETQSILPHSSAFEREEIHSHLSQCFMFRHNFILVLVSSFLSFHLVLLEFLKLYLMHLLSCTLSLWDPRQGFTPGALRAATGAC